MSDAILRTERFTLRPFEDADAHSLLAMRKDPEATRYWGGEPMRTLADARREIETVRGWVSDGRVAYWVIQAHEDPVMLGHVTLFHVDRVNRRSELGFFVARERWGHGIATEVCRVVVDHAFGAMGLHRLEADVDPANAPSLALLAKLGFREEGLFKERWWIGERWCDSVMLGLLASDWPTRG